MQMDPMDMNKGRDIIETKGVTALHQLFAVAKRDSGQCRYIAGFLLGLYNGRRFPFDLTDLRAIDDDLFEACMVVLRMDARVTRQEIHLYFENGGRQFEDLAAAWNLEDVEKVRADAKRAEQPDGSPAPLHDGGVFSAKLHTYGDAPGYRDVSLVLKVGEQHNTQIDLQLSPADSESVMQHIMGVHAAAWRNGEPMDAKPGEKRPAWLDRMQAR